MIFDPPNTPEQADIIDFALTRKENLLVNALAGTAKTTTIERVGTVCDRTPILYLVFNKRNRDEAAERMPSHVDCRTFNALGHRAWSNQIGRRLTIDTKKSYTILKGLINELGRAEKSEAYESFSEILAAARLAKVTGYIPSGRFEGVNPLVRDDPFDEEPTWLQTHLLDALLTKSIKVAYSGTIDFDDQIYMPTLFGGTWPQFPLVMVDEAQDLSPINHAMLEHLACGRIIAVGDPWQSIYAFRGAMQQGMEALRSGYSMETRGLSISFRCPRSIVHRARSHVPTFSYPEWAIEGEVNELSSWTTDNIIDGSTIICRNNAPLFSLAVRLIRDGRGGKLVGSDIGPNLLRSLKKLGPESLTTTQVFDAINRAEAEALAKARYPASTADKFECLRVFAGQGPNLSAAIGYANHLFAAGGTIQLISGHKAKGLEWDTTYHLDPWRIPSRYAITKEELNQELNIRYVIETRAKRVLNVINLGDLK